ncbi:MAG: tetratricopeptide repeat protein [Anaerolineae bacterium]
MAMVQTNISRTSGTALREMLRQYEIGVANPKEKGQQILDVFRLRDEIEESVTKLQSDHVDIRAELTRLESADALLIASTSKFNKELRSSGGLAAARAKSNSPEEKWWWYIDVALAAKNKRRFLTLGITAGSIIIILAVALLLVNRYAGPPPAFKESLTHMTKAEGYLQEKNYNAAIAEIEIAATLTPPELRITPTADVKGTVQSMAPVYANADPQVYLAVLYTLTGRPSQATSMEKAAEMIMGSREGVLEAMAQEYFNLNELDYASKTVDDLLALNIDNARAYYIRGSIEEMRNQLPEALADFKHSAELAQAQFASTLFAMAQTRYVNLLQRIPNEAGPTNTPAS